MNELPPTLAMPVSPRLRGHARLDVVASPLAPHPNYPMRRSSLRPLHPGDLGPPILDDQGLPGLGAAESPSAGVALVPTIAGVAAAAGTSEPRDFPQSCFNLSRNRFQPFSTDWFDMRVSARRLDRRDVVEGVQG
jgi:hypothetical protein